MPARRSPARSAGLPATAKSLSLNVTVVSAPGTGSLIAYPGNLTAAPNVTLINFTAGNTRANNIVVALSSAGLGTLALNSSITGLDV